MTTRDTLQRTALRLFAERGYDHVTVDEIAETAGFSHMTFFRHFPTKESAVLDDPYDPVFGRLVGATDPDLPAFDRVLTGLAGVWEHVDEPDDETTRLRIRLAAGHPKLRARVWENNQRTEDVIAGALISTGTPELDARVATGAVLGAITAALLHWATDEDDRSLGEVVRAALDRIGPDR